MFAEFFLAGMMLFGPSPAEELARQVSIGRDVLFPANIFLVTAEARKPNVWEIQHVYVGPPELKGQSILGEFRRQPDWRDVGSTIPLKEFWQFLLGEGLFWITKDNSGKLKFCSGADDHTRFRFHYSWIKGGDYYPLHLGPAEALEAVYRASDQERLARIDGILRSGDIAKAEAVMWQLPKYSKDPKKYVDTAKAQVVRSELAPKITDYLVALGRDRTLRVSIQIQVHSMIAQRVKDWFRSAEYLQRADQWLTEPWKGQEPPRYDPNKPAIASSDEGSLVHVLSAMARNYSKMPHAQVLDFAVKGLANPQRSNSFRESVVRDYKDQFASDWSRDELKEGFAYLLKAVESRPKAAEKAAAAHLLAVFAPFDENQKNQLRMLLANTTDDVVARELKTRLGD